MASDCSATDGPHGLMYLRFFLTHPRVLSFGVLLTLFSSFGQTFLISIFVPRLLIEFRLNTAQFGAIYAGATLASAASLPLLRASVGSGHIARVQSGRWPGAGHFRVSPWRSRRMWWCSSLRFSACA
jgi:hypothetical protein